ncbi:hypothetical protein ACFL5O_07990 [Myxococcota bacterium]
MGYDWGSNLDLSELKGELALAVRLRFLFFKRTFKRRRFSWPGLHQSYPLVAAAGGGAAVRRRLREAGGRDCLHRSRAHCGACPGCRKWPGRCFVQQHPHPILVGATR